MDCSTPGFPILTISWILLKSISTEFPLSHPLSSPSPPTFNLSQHQGFYNELALPIRWPNYWSFSVSISPSSDYSGLISFRTDSCSTREPQESFSTPQFKSISYLVFSFLYGPTLTSIDHYRKPIALTRWTFVVKVMSLFFNTLSRFIISFL